MLTSPLKDPGGVLREQIADRPILLPGVFNGISTLSASDAGARALYLSGAGLTNATFGVPDIGLATLTEFAAQARAITAVVQLPVISDADTGFGQVHNVRRTVIELERAGLAAIHLEDQDSPKRCGHLEGKSLITAEAMAQKVSAAVDAKAKDSFMVIARTDARGVEGLYAAIDRARRYVDAGADAIFPEGLTSEAEFEAFRRAIHVPLMANMTEYGKTPIIPAARFAQLGYEMTIFPMTAFRVMLKALDEAYRELMQTGTQSGLLDRMRTRQELYQRVRYDEYERLDRELGGG